MPNYYQNDFILWPCKNISFWRICILISIWFKGAGISLVNVRSWFSLAKLVQFSHMELIIENNHAFIHILRSSVPQKPWFVLGTFINFCKV